ncbi:MAG: sel1 repeat family protein [Massilia sp.]|nr:sel1 repeat family protein [Massilia sp.]
MKGILATAALAALAALVLAAPAAASTDPAAALRLGLAWRNGIGRAADPAEARRCLQEAAKGGEPAAMFVLAHMLADGEGGPPDAVAAHAWLQEAAEHDYPEALQELALGEPDPQRADALMRAAAHALAHRAHAARDALNRE